MSQQMNEQDQNNNEFTTQTERVTNLKLWNTVKKTDPKKTKKFKRTDRSPQFTSIDPYYVIQKITSQFGPMGVHWGYREVEQKIEHKHWMAKIELWYNKNLVDPSAEGQASITQWGIVPFEVVNKETGELRYHDADAGKKAITGALTKAASFLGFASDVYLGMHDNPYYVENLNNEIQEKINAAAKKKQAPEDGAPNLPNISYKKVKSNNKTWLIAEGDYSEENSRALQDNGFVYSNEKNFFYRELAAEAA